MNNLLAKKEAERKERLWRVTFADGKHTFVMAKSSMEAVKEGKKLYFMTIQKVEDSF